jgi:hypothetical protein
MNLTYCEEGNFPFPVPEMDASFASSTGPRTVYPAGFPLDQAMQIYWRAQNYALTATGGDVLGSVTQALSATGNLPPRNALVGQAAFGLATGLAPTGPLDVVPGVGMRQQVPGGGTITASGPLGNGTDPAVLNLQVNLFWPEIYTPDPMVKYNGLWWPALSISCLATNTVNLDSGGALSVGFDCTTLPEPASTTEIGSFSFFGVNVPVFCTALAPAEGGDPAETRTFTGSLTVANEWP